MIRSAKCRLAISFTLVAIIGFSLSACQTIQPIYNVDSYPLVKSASNLSQSDLELLVVEAGVARGWRMTQTEPGKIEGTLNLRKHEANIVITIDQNTFSINHVSSSNLHEKDGHIDRNYNRWIRYLEHDIAGKITNASRTARP